MSPTTTADGGAPPHPRDGARRTSLAGRAGRWSARHRKTAILGWLLIVVLATVVGGAVTQHNVPASEQGNGESKRGDMIVDAAGYPDVSREQVLVQGTGSLTARDARVKDAARDVVDRLRRLPGVTDVRSPLRGPGRASLVSHDGRSLLVTFDLRGAPEDNERRVAVPLAAVAAVGRAHPGVRVEQFGDASQLRGVKRPPREPYLPSPSEAGPRFPRRSTSSPDSRRSGPGNSASGGWSDCELLADLSGELRSGAKQA